MEPSPLLWAKCVSPPFVGHFCYIQSKSVIFAAWFLLRGFWRGNYRGTGCTVELLLEDGTEDRKTGHISFSLQHGWLDLPSFAMFFPMWHCLVHVLFHKELYLSIVMTYLWQGLTIAPLTYARKLRGKMTSQKSLMEWMVWKIECQSYGKKAL